ncbi:MAG: hypothetical protein JW751_13725 [Polyangiaceae bacterium]|nr:hypothetical protein [Polyangiaceae bacterium]
MLGNGSAASRLLVVAGAALLVACSDTDEDEGADSGGAPATGGLASGGLSDNGGAAPSGGQRPDGAGGTGAVETGGSGGSGGSVGTGGQDTGGVGTGGIGPTGGQTSGGVGTGGIGPTGGQTSGGAGTGGIGTGGTGGIGTGGIPGGAGTGGFSPFGGFGPTGGRFFTGGVSPTGGVDPTGGVAPTGGVDSPGGAATTGGNDICADGPLETSLPNCEPAPAVLTGDYHVDCVNRINQFRADCQCLPPLERWEAGEACADEMAEYDSEVQRAHAGFMADVCSPGGTAQCECPGWSSVESIIVNERYDPCLTMMWHEVDEPTGEQGHYEAMSNTRYTRVACGVFTTSQGEVWAVQNYSQ